MTETIRRKTPRWKTFLRRTKTKAKNAGAMAGRCLAWAWNGAKKISALLCLVGLVALGAFGLFSMDPPRQKVRACNDYCRLLLGDNDRPKTSAMYESFETCTNFCRNDPGKKTAAKAYVRCVEDKKAHDDKNWAPCETEATGKIPPPGQGVGKNQVPEWLSSRAPRVFETDSEVLNGLFSLLLNVALLAVLIGLLGIVVLVFLSRFSFESLKNLWGGINSDMLKLFVSGAAIAATTAGAGYVTAKSTNPPDLSNLIKQSSALEKRLADIDEQTLKLREHLEEASSIDLTARIQGVEEQIQKLQATVKAATEEIQTANLQALQEAVQRQTTQIASLEAKIGNIRGGPMDITALTQSIKLMEKQIEIQRGSIQKLDTNVQGLDGTVKALLKGDDQLTKVVEQLTASQKELQRLRKQIEVM